jgi:hypothetical protein
VLGGYRGAVVVVARIGRLDARIGLRRERGDNVRECIVRQPRRAVIVGLARPHPVTGNGWVAPGAASTLARVIPRRQEAAGRTDREVRLPLRTGRGVGVQLERRGKGYTAVGRANVIDVARVSGSTVLGIDQVNDVVQGSRLTPALVPPVAAAIGKYASEVTHGCHAGAGKNGTCVRMSPRVTPVS